MTSINLKERRNAFLTFLIFFTITIILVIAVVFFSVKVPFEENEQLKQEMAKVEKQREFQRSFGNTYWETYRQLDSFNLKDVEPVMMEARIKNNLSIMSMMNIQDSISGQANFYEYAIKGLTTLMSAKKTLREQSDLSKDVEILKEQKKNLENSPQVSVPFTGM